MTRVDVSVVIPARNRAETLPSCLESVLAQSYPAREVIVVDDGSTDATEAVVRSYAARGVRYERATRGKGAQAARNQGILSAGHEWIAFQDSDDRWLPDKLERQVRALDGGSRDVVVHTSGRRLDAATGRTTPMVEERFEGDCYAKLLLRAGPMFQGLLVHRRALEEIGLLDESCPSFQEWDTVIRLARIRRFVHLTEPLFEWVWHGGATISKDLARDAAGHRYVLEKHRDEILRVHGARGWRVAVSALVAKLLAQRAWDEARRLADQELPATARELTRVLARAGWTPRSTPRLLRAAARLPV